MIVVALGGLALLGAALPWTSIARTLRARREGQGRRSTLPALIEAVAAALAAGLSLEQAFAEVAPTLPVTLARPTGEVAASLRLGEPIDRALAAYDPVVAAADL